MVRGYRAPSAALQRAQRLRRLLAGLDDEMSADEERAYVAEARSTVETATGRTASE